MTKRIALLICGELKGTALALHGDYLEVYTRFLAETVPAGVAYTVTPFFVARTEVLPEPDLFDALVITGSAANAYDDIPWINSLIAYLAHVIADKPDLKIIGICFGHQVVARALDGSCVPNGGRWELGPTRVSLTPLGRKVFGSRKTNDKGREVREDEDNDGILTIQQMHRDHVPALPPSVHLLGSTELSPIQGIVRFAPSASISDYNSTSAGLDDSPLPPIQVLAVQGHPEFTPSIASALVSERSATGVIDAPTAEDYWKREGWKDDGTGRIGDAVWKVILE